jgi:osmotically-inducible protein OsmY
MMATDDELRTSVEMELEWEPSVDESELGVSVVDGLLTLTGEAGSYAEKWRAERAAARVLGVRGITNEIEVHPGGDKTDLEIARAVADALKWNVMVPSDRVTAEVDRGWVFLEGEVVWNFQRIATERAVRNMAGVKGVSNLITLKPIVEPQDVKMRIEDSFKRASFFDAADVTVDVAGGEVTLRGRMRSWFASQGAEEAAWAAPGVTEVHNFIVVEPDSAAA